MPHESRYLCFLAACLALIPLSAEPPEPSPAGPEAPEASGPPLPGQEELLAPEAAPTQEPGGPGGLPEEEVELEELRPVTPPPGDRKSTEENSARDSYWSPADARARPDGPLEPLTRAPELMGPMRKYRSLLQSDSQPATRVGFQGFYGERRNRNRYSTIGTGTFLAEYALLPYASMYFVAPYTRKDEPESAAREHTDNVSAGMRFAPGNGMLRPAMGFEFFFATGNEDLGIGSHDKGNLETYFGFILARSRFSAQGSLRYNTQSNLELNPPPGEKFERTWLVDLGLGFRLDQFEFVLEATRRGRIAPEENRLWTTVLTPGINIGPRTGRGFVFSVGVPWTLSRAREYDYGILMRGMWVF